MTWKGPLVLGWGLGEETEETGMAGTGEGRLE